MFCIKQRIDNLTVPTFSHLAVVQALLRGVRDVDGCEDGLDALAVDEAPDGVVQLPAGEGEETEG